jgi:hypothetical protein
LKKVIELICYVYFKESKIINCWIDNIEYISDNDKEIKSSTNSIKYGDSQDYIILESDIINKNIGDVIDLSNIEDARDFFIKGKDYWYQKQIKQHEEIIQNQSGTILNLNTLLKTTNETIEGFMNFYFEQTPDQA